MTSAWILFGILLLLVLANALFVAVEFAYITVDRTRVAAAAADGDPVAKEIQQGISTLSFQLSGAQLGITATSLITGYLAEPSLGTLLQAALGGTDLPQGVVLTISIAGAFLISTFLQMAFGELVPKTWAIAEPGRVARMVARPQRVYMTLFGWLIRIFDRNAERVVRRMGIEPHSEHGSARSPAELVSVVQYSGQEGTLDEQTAELVSRSIEFGNLAAAEVMIPRPRVEFVGRDTSVAELLDVVVRTGHSRFPVQGEDVDDIVGLIHYKLALGVKPEERGDHMVEEFMVEPHVVAETMTLDPLMRELRGHGLQLAVVIDEYGGTAGLVTLEDLVEEIVGEIRDEHDPYTRRYRRTPGGGWALSGLLRPDEVGAIIGLEVPEGEDTDTIAGLVVEQLDRIPEVGESAVVECTDQSELDEKQRARAAWIRITVVALDGHRVDRVVVDRFDSDPRPTEDDETTPASENEAGQLPVDVEESRRTGAHAAEEDRA